MWRCVHKYSDSILSPIRICLQQSCESLKRYLATYLQSAPQVFMTKYYFWVSIFLVFFAAVSRVSMFGFFYLLLCFALVYRGQNMLEDRQTTRTRRWRFSHQCNYVLYWEYACAFFLMLAMACARTDMEYTFTYKHVPHIFLSMQSSSVLSFKLLVLSASFLWPTYLHN